MIEKVEEIQTPKNIWKLTGLTEHLGGIQATKNIIHQINIQKQPIVMDLGCGSGYTVQLLAERKPQKLIAMDLLLNNCLSTRRRISKAILSPGIHILQSDAQSIPITNESIDFIIIESVLVFCNLPIVLNELWRILRPGGFIGINELTYHRPSYINFADLLRNLFGINAFSRQDWEQSFKQAGFRIRSSSEFPIRFIDQLVSHVVIDGIFNYLKALITALKEPAIWKSFINPELIKVFIKNPKFIGYGIYILEKKDA